MDKEQFRIIIFFTGLILFSLLELLFSKRKRLPGHWFRYSNNLIITFMNSFVLKLIFPLLAIDVAYKVKENGFGLFNLIELSSTLNIVITVIILDMIIYFQHKIFHIVPVLWKLHGVHHSDIELDTSSALRFHTIEIVLSMIIKLFFIVLLGASPLGVFIFEVLLNFLAMFNHANINIPPAIDKWIRKIIVTPDFHRIHHSSIRKEDMSNYGFCLTIWDYIFSSYIAEPKLGQLNMELGLKNQFRESKDQRLDKLLIQPFVKLYKK
jgi:sterol desaturase/sphingolipid hydroxylase (fatty acid hydroxylase superfamily)